MGGVAETGGGVDFVKAQETAVRVAHDWGDGNLVIGIWPPK